MKKIIEEKKKRGLKQPKYNMRKLSVGLVSCVIGFSVLARPVVAIADSVQTENSVVSTPTYVAPTENVASTPIPKSAKPVEKVVEEKKMETTEDKKIVADEKYVKEIDELVSPITKLYEKSEEIKAKTIHDALKETDKKAKEKLPHSNEDVYTSAELLLPEKEDISKERKLGYAKYNENYVFEGIAKRLEDESKNEKKILKSPDKIFKKETKEALTKEKETLSKSVDDMVATKELVKKFYEKLKEINKDYALGDGGFGFEEKDLGKVLSILDESAKESKNILGRDLEVYYNLKNFNKKLEEIEKKDKEEFNLEQTKEFNKLKALLNDTEKLLTEGDKNNFTELLDGKHEGLLNSIKDTLKEVKDGITSEKFTDGTKDGYDALKDKVEDLETDLYSLQNYYLIFNLEEQMKKDLPLETDEAKEDFKKIQEDFRDIIDTIIDNEADSTNADNYAAFRKANQDYKKRIAELKLKDEKLKKKQNIGVPRIDKPDMNIPKSGKPNMDTPKINKPDHKPENQDKPKDSDKNKEEMPNIKNDKDKKAKDDAEILGKLDKDTKKDILDKSEKDTKKDAFGKSDKDSKTDTSNKSGKDKLENGNKTNDIKLERKGKSNFSKNIKNNNPAREEHNKNVKYVSDKGKLPKMGSIGDTGIYAEVSALLGTILLVAGFKRKK